MAFTNQFGSLTQWVSGWLDTNFNEAGSLGTIPCTVSGTNTLVLTPYTTPTAGTPPFALQPLIRVSGIAAASNTGAVTAAVGGTAALNVYNDTAAGPVALTGGEIHIGNAFTLTYDAALNSGNGGYHLGSASSISAGTVTSVATGAGLSGGPVTTTGTITLASIAQNRLLGNITGGSAAPIALSLTSILDTIISSTQGAILNRGASTWGAATEQAWTPALALGGAATGMTYATQGGQYFTVGYLVVASFNLVLSAKGSSTGVMTLSLPVASGSGNRIGIGLISSYSNFTSVTTVPWINIPASSSTGSCLIAGSATTTAIQDTNLANNTALAGLLVYFSG
jgi:trimeric autotransporter adhesin